jgi:hypothetical protein
MHNITRLWAGVGFVLATASASATPPAQDTDDWTPVSAEVLDDTRGGFVLDSGLSVSFGLERLVSLNGTVVSRLLLEIPDVSRLTAEQAQQTREALSAVKLIQAGHDNIYLQSTPGQALGATVIQNSLNDQVIRAQTVITASVNSLALLQALRLERSLVEAIAVSASPH